MNTRPSHLPSPDRSRNRCSRRREEADLTSHRIRLVTSAATGRCLLALLLLSLLLTASAPAQIPFTNSATLAISFDGTNVLLRAGFAETNGAFTLVQGARPDALTLPACSCQISNQIFDIGWVPAARQVQWTLTNWPAASARFFRLQLEPFLTRGRALVFKDGPLDFDAMRRTYGDITNSPTALRTNNGTITYAFPYDEREANKMTPMIFKQPVEVWIDNLGTYDTNGVLVGGNEGKSRGKYLETALWTIDQREPSFGWSPVGSVSSESNDFRIEFTGQRANNPREAILWSSEVQLYHDINYYRCHLLNDAFIAELRLPSEIEDNLRRLQYRPGLVTFGTSGFARRPLIVIGETYVPRGINLSPVGNIMDIQCRTRSLEPVPGTPVTPVLPPLTHAYESAFMAGEYAGLVAFWIAGTNVDAFTSDAFYTDSDQWATNVLPALNDGLNAWVAYRYSEDREFMRYWSYLLRMSNGRPCGGTNVPCDKGQTARNVMMFDEANYSREGVFPFRSRPSQITNLDGPVGSDWSGLYIAAIFYDIANEAGLGIHKADLLIWKSISLTTGPPLPMRTYGAKIQEAARLLWSDPRPGREGRSLYEEDINDVLTSRGIPLNGVADFRTNLPPFIGDATTLDRISTTNPGFGSGHPAGHPGANFYGSHTTFTNRYTHPDTNAAYVAYRFYKHSKFGPCDKLVLTDGSFTVNTTNEPFEWSYNSNGTFYIELTDRELGNLVVFLPQRSVTWMNSRQRCPNEATGFYAEDVRPFGFRVIQATPNGFSFTATALSETPTNKIYQLTIVDPSLTSVGPADYAWSFTNHFGTAFTATGPTAQYTALKDQPFTISIARSRAGETNTLTLRERGNDLDRNEGRAFVRNMTPGD